MSGRRDRRGPVGGTFARVGRASEREVIKAERKLYLHELRGLRRIGYFLVFDDTRVPGRAAAGNGCQGREHKTFEKDERERGA